jgi:hypothetical protein
MDLPEFLQHLEGVKANGRGHVALCPAHDDHEPSLSVTNGDGRILLKCFAGCTAEQVMGALGLAMADLFQDHHQEGASAPPRPAPRLVSPIDENVVPALHAALSQKARAYLGEKRLLADGVMDRYELGVEKRDGVRRVTIPVRDRDGAVRDIRRWLAPEAREAESPKILHWKPGYGAPRLFPADQLQEDELVFCEGELDALALISHDIHAVTLTAGCDTAPTSNQARLFAGKVVTLLGDADEPGQKGALKRAAALAPHVREVRIASFPEDRPKGWDVTDELRANGVESVRGILNQAVPFEAAEATSPTIDQIEPFPLGALAGPLRDLVGEAAAAIQCPPDFVAVPLLTVAGAAAGATCRLVLKDGWEEQPALFSAVVAAPGTAKTAAQRTATRPVFDHAAQLRNQWEAQDTQYEAELVEWERNRKDPKPQAPRMPRVVVSDATVEAVAQVLDENPRGLALVRDELSGWAQSLDAYRSGKGGDRQFYLSVWSGAALSVDRKKQDRLVILDRPFLAITGALPPDTVRSLLHDDRRDDGFIDRILFAYPDARPPVHWSEDTVASATVDAVNSIFERLYGLLMALGCPTRVRMDGAAKDLWVEWYERHQSERLDVEENLWGVWAKMPIQAARLILISHLTRWAVGEAPSLEVADDVSVARGTALAEYFKSHARRVWGLLAERPADRVTRRVEEWLRRRKKPGIRPRDVERAGVPDIADAAEAREILGKLAATGKGEWRPAKSGLSGQKGAEYFFLNSPDTRQF